MSEKSKKTNITMDEVIWSLFGHATYETIITNLNMAQKFFFDFSDIKILCISLRKATQLKTQRIYITYYSVVTQVLFTEFPLQCPIISGRAAEIDSATEYRTIHIRSVNSP